MNDLSNHDQIKNPTRAEWGWLVKILLLPRRTLSAILKAERPVWFPALLVLSLASLAFVLANGFIRQRIGIDNPAQLPEYFQYYTPAQQEQFMQALQATSGSAFLFILPGMLSLAKVWLGWLFVSSLVYLSLTAVGSGIKWRTVVNLIAWASMPLALRDLVRSIAVVSSASLIQAPGLSGFVSGGGNISLFLTALLALIDLYWIWQVVIVNIGNAMVSKTSRRKTIVTVTLTMILILVLQALVGFGIARLGSNITAVQVFF